MHHKREILQFNNKPYSTYQGYYILRIPTAKRGKVNNGRRQRKLKLRSIARKRTNRCLNTINKRKLRLLNLKRMAFGNSELRPQQRTFLKNFLQLLHDQWLEVQVKQKSPEQPSPMRQKTLDNQTQTDGPEVDSDYCARDNSFSTPPVQMYFETWRYNEQNKSVWDEMFANFIEKRNQYMIDREYMPNVSSNYLIARNKHNDNRVHFYRAKNILKIPTNSSSTGLRVGLYLCYLLNNVRLMTEFRVLREKINLEQQSMYLGIMRQPIFEYTGKKPALPPSVVKRWQENRINLTDLQWLQRERENIGFRIKNQNPLWLRDAESQFRFRELQTRVLASEQEFEEINKLINARVQQLWADAQYSVENIGTPVPFCDRDTLLQCISNHEAYMQQLLTFIEERISEINLRKIMCDYNEDMIKEFDNTLQKFNNYQYYLLDQCNYSQQLIPKTCLSDILQHKIDCLPNETQAKYLWHLYDVYKLAHKMFEVYLEYIRMNDEYLQAKIKKAFPDSNA